MIRLSLILSALFFFGLPPQDATSQVTPAEPPMPSAAIHKTNPVKPTAESQARARKIYGYDCASCHGDTGSGKSDTATDMKLLMADFTDPAALNGRPDSELFSIIRNGKGKMPAEGDRAKTDEVWNLVYYLRSMSKSASSSAPAGQ